MNSGRLRRAERAAATLGPPPEAVAAARAQLVAEAIARIRREPCEHDQAAAAIVRADALRRGIDLDNPEVVDALRARLLDASRSRLPADGDDPGRAASSTR